jgi:hypothetical protein
MGELDVLLAIGVFAAPAARLVTSPQDIYLLAATL